MRFPEGITKWIPTILWPATLTHPNETFFASENVTSLNEEEKLSCEGVVSEDECLRTLKEFKIVSPLAQTVFLRSFTNFLDRNQYRYNRKLQLRLQNRNALH